MYQKKASIIWDVNSYNKDFIYTVYKNYNPNNMK